MTVMTRPNRADDAEFVSPSRTASSGSVEVPAMARWLPAARLAWAAVAIVSLGSFLVTVGLGYGQLSHVTGETRHALARAGLSPTSYALLRLALDTAFVAVFTIVGWVIYLRRRADWMALLTALALVVWGPNNGALVGNGYGPPSTNTGLAAVGAALVGLIGYGSWMLFFYLFPSGHFVPRWTRLCAGAWVVMVVLWAATPFGPPNWPPVFAGVLLAVLWGSFAVSQVYRYWRVSTPTQRRQTKWVVCGIVVGVTGDRVVSSFLGGFIARQTADTVQGLAANGLTDLFAAVIPVSIGFAILKSRLFAIDTIINRALVYGTLTALVVGGYVLVVGGLGTLVQAHGSLVLSLAATAVVAVLFQPLREHLQRLVNRLLYGQRDDPYAVLTSLGRRLEATLAPDAVLPELVAMVAQALKLPYVAIALLGDDQPEGRRDRGVGATADRSPASRPEEKIVAVHGIAVADLLSLPLVAHHEAVGHLLLAPRAPAEPFTPADCRLLGDLARQVGLAVQTVRLTADLQRSRERLVTTREEERRRLRRDLHDGLGPTLASLSQRLDTAALLVTRDPPAAAALLRELKGQVKGTVADIRRLVYALRPPALDDFGLLGALRAYIASRDGAEPRVTITAPAALPALPAAVEVAAYRIVVEALINVARHAQARTCAVRVELADALCLEVVDDGAGLPIPYQAGIGTAAMRERAAEVGGICMIEPGLSGGTRVWARLPLGQD